MLDSIASAIHWDKVNQGMMKMYKVLHSIDQYFFTKVFDHSNSEALRN